MKQEALIQANKYLKQIEALEIKLSQAKANLEIKAESRRVTFDGNDVKDGRKVQFEIFITASQVDFLRQSYINTLKGEILILKNKIANL